MIRQTTRFGILALSVLGGILLLAVFAVGVAASAPATPDPGSDSASAAIVASTPISLPSPSWRIGITADGLYRLTYETLNAAEVPVAGADPSHFHLLWRGQEMALQEVSDGDSTFETGEAFLFYAEKFHGSTQDEKYTDENVYWLTVDDSAAGLRMDDRSVAPGGGTALEWYTASVHIEENLEYWARWSTNPGTDATWFWDRLDTNPVTPTVTGTYPIILVAPSSIPHTATLTLEVAARIHNPAQNPDHHLRLTVNNTTAGEVTWDGMTGAVLSVPVASTALVSGVNQVHVAVLSDLSTYQAVHVDWIELAFRRETAAEGDVLAWTTPLSGATGMALTGFTTNTVHLYDITHPLTPTRLVNAAVFLSGTAYAAALSDAAPEGTAYLAVAESAILETPPPTIHYPTDLLDPAEGADEIIIAPAQFITALQPLSGLRRSQGLRVQIVDVQDVYATFNGGVVHPEAIRSFVAYAYANWPGDPPAYLLLVGDGDLNPKGYSPQVYGEFVPTLIPPYLEFADPDQGEVPVDSRYGDLDWHGMPEVAVGRIPANTVEQVEGFVAKIIAYESGPSVLWQDRVLMVADNYDPGTGDFKALAEDLRYTHVPSDQFDVQTVYLDDYSSAPSATYALTQTWSQGAALLTYAGHGAVHRWAHEPLLLNAQLASLTGTVGLPFVISLDCWDGYWMFPSQYPNPDFVGQSLQSTGEWATTILTDRGAIAVFGPAGLGHLSTEEILAKAMYRDMFENGTRRIGDITQAGRQIIFWSYMGRTYTLLGDPATLLALDPLERVYLPLTLKE